MGEVQKKMHQLEQEVSERETQLTMLKDELHTLTEHSSSQQQTIQTMEAK